MKRLHVITTARSDFSVWVPFFDGIIHDKRFETKMIVTGTHFLSSLGDTYQEVHSRISKKNYIDVPIPNHDDPVQYLPAMFSGYSKLIENESPDLICVLGDRFELLPILNAVILQRLPLAHFYGGEIDVGYCIDTQVRNAVTKMSHIHLVAHADNKARVLAMGEEDWRICIAGEEVVKNSKTVDEKAIIAFLTAGNIELGNSKLISVCYLPPTVKNGLWKKELSALFEALDRLSGYTYVWTGVNADPEGFDLKRKIEKEISYRKNHYFFDHLGGELFKSLMTASALMIGNSSSGLREAASMKLPVVNVGVRQTGRLHGDNVLDCPANVVDILNAVALAQQMDRTKIQNIFENPRFPTNAIEHLWQCLKRSDLLIKHLSGVRQGTVAIVPEYP